MNSFYIGYDTILMPSDYCGESKILLEDSLINLSNIFNTTIFWGDCQSAGSMANVKEHVKYKSQTRPWEAKNQSTFVGFYDFQNKLVKNSKEVL